MKIRDIAKNGRPDHESALSAAREFLRDGNHADAAQAFLLHGEFTSGVEERRNTLMAADICAKLSIRDALQEATATMREVGRRQVESNDELASQFRSVA